jgi:putative transposase
MYAHLVWTTKYRAARLTAEIENNIYRCIVAQSQEARCPVLAVGGTEDHVHLVVRLYSRISIAELVQRVKGPSSALFNDLRPEHSERFSWQDGYGCFSLWYTQLDKAIAYVRNQKQRHTTGDLIDIFEQFDEPVTTPNRTAAYETY